MRTVSARFTVALALAVLLSPLSRLAGQVPEVSAAPAGLNFLVLSDWGGKGGTGQVAVARSLGRIAEAQKARFVVTCGDNYHGNGIDSADSPRWQTEYEAVYSSPSLQIPWYPSLGNHDNRGKADAEIEYSKVSPRWKFPARYYAHSERIDDGNEALFVHLDTSPFVAAYRKPGSSYKVQNEDPKAQLRWLNSTLSQSRARWKIVIGHHPVYSAAPGHGDTKELIADVLPVLRKHGVKIYFCGHDHVLQHLVNGEMNFFICGGGSSHRVTQGREDVRFGVGSLGFLAMSVSATTAEARFYNEQGKELYRVRIPAAGD
jgi:acid phosphatase